MAYTLQQLSDMEDIRVLKHRYFRGIDTADMAVLETLFTDDVEARYYGGGYRVEVDGKADFLTFLANSFNSDSVAMHFGLMPEVRMTGEDSAEGVWTLYDVFISLERQDHTYGSAVYKDVYRREGGVWKIARTHYDRVAEVVLPHDARSNITAHRLGTTGMKPEARTDIGHFIKWG